MTINTSMAHCPMARLKMLLWDQDGLSHHIISIEIAIERHRSSVHVQQRYCFQCISELPHSE